MLLAKASLLSFDGHSVLACLDRVDCGCISSFAALVTGGGKWDSVCDGDDVVGGCTCAAVGVEEVSQECCDPCLEEDC